MTGRELAIYQAADAFELFTGHAPSVAAMGSAFDEPHGRGEFRFATRPESCGPTTRPLRPMMRNDAKKGEDA